MPNRYTLSSFFNRLKRKKGFKKKKGFKTKTNIFDTKLFNVVKNIVIVSVIAFVTYTVIYPTGMAIYGFKLEEYPNTEHLQREWNRGERLNLLLIGVDDLSQDNKFVDSIALMVVDPDAEQVGIFNINPDLAAYSPALRKTIYIRSAFNESNDEVDGLTNTIEAVENLLAIRVDKYILMDKDGFNNATQSFQAARIDFQQKIHDQDLAKLDSKVLGWDSGKQSIYPDEFLALLAADELGKNDQLNRQLDFYRSQIENINSVNSYIHISNLLDDIADNIYTNMTEFEFYRLLWELRSLRSDQVKVAYTRQESMIKSDAFGIYPRYEPILENIDQDLSSILFNTDILKEQAKIEVLNGSGVSGLAYNRARWITNMGGRVILYSNSPVQEPITKIYVDDKEKFPNTLNGIERVFNGKIEYPQQEYQYKHVGDIIIVIGEEYE